MEEWDRGDLARGATGGSDSDSHSSRNGLERMVSTPIVGALAAGSGPDWVGFAVNAASGRGSGRALVGRVVRELERLGVESRIAWTIDERRALVDAASTSGRGPSGRCHCLVAVGGDGTVAALINEQPDVPIA